MVQKGRGEGVLKVMGVEGRREGVKGGMASPNLWSSLASSTLPKSYFGQLVLLRPILLWPINDKCKKLIVPNNYFRHCNYNYNCV